MDDGCIMYTGTIKRRRKKKKTAINIRSIALWYAGILVSFTPVAIDVVAYLAKDTLNRSYWVKVCLRGDILWILATIIVLTVIDYVSDNGNRNGILQRICAVFAIVMWGIVFGLWILFKYVYPADYDKDLPVILTLIVAAVTILCCSPLQVKEAEK